MPIDYAKYPPDWKERRKGILVRAGNCCEWCGVANRTVCARDAFNTRHTKDEIEAMGWVEFFRRFKESDIKYFRVVLTIAHLDHDETNWDVKDERLAALCEQCHLRYDAPEKAKRRRVKKYEQSLFPI